MSENYSKNGKKIESRNDKEFANIMLGENENKRDFLRRVNRITHESLQEAKFEAKYGVEVVRNKQTGEIGMRKKPSNEIDEILRQNRLKGNKGAKATSAPSLVLKPEEKKKLVKEMMEKKKAAKASAAVPTIVEYKKDEFKFGEVVHAPPQLITPRGAQKAETVRRVSASHSIRMDLFSLLIASNGHECCMVHVSQPGRKMMFPQSTDTKQSEPSGNQVKAKTATTKKLGTLKGKRKDLSMAMRHMIDTEQSNVVKLYKEIKANQRLKTT